MQQQQKIKMIKNMHPIFKLKDMYYNNVHHVLRFFFTVDFDSLCQFVFFSFVSLNTEWSADIISSCAIKQWFTVTWFDCVLALRSKEHLYLIGDSERAKRVYLTILDMCVMFEGSITFTVDFSVFIHVITLDMRECRSSLFLLIWIFKLMKSRGSCHEHVTIHIFS